MKTFKQALFFAICTFFFFSCQEEITTHQSTSANDNPFLSIGEKAFIRRGKIKKKSTVGYKVRVIASNDDNDSSEDIPAIAQAEYTILPSGDVFPSPSNFPLENKGLTDAGDVRFVFKDLNFEGGEPDGISFTTITQFRDENGADIGAPVTDYITVQDNDGLSMKAPKLSMKNDGETFKLRLVLKGDNIGQVEKVQVSLTPDDGGSESDPATFELTLTGETETSRIYKNNSITFIESDNVVDMEYIAAVSVSDAGGEELDYAEFRITGLE